MKITVNDTRIITAYGDGIHHAIQEKETTFMINTNEMQGDLQVYMEGKVTSEIFSNAMYFSVEIRP